MFLRQSEKNTRMFVAKIWLFKHNHRRGLMEANKIKARWNDYTETGIHTPDCRTTEAFVNQGYIQEPIPLENDIQEQ